MLANEIGNVYSHALFDLSKRDSIPATLTAVEEILSDFKFFIETWDSQPRFAKFLISPLVRLDHKKKALVEIFKAQVSKTFLNFLLLLVDRNRQYFIQRIWRYYMIRYDAFKHQQRVVVESVLPLSQDELSSITIYIKEKIKDDALIENRINPDLIGGIVIHTPTQVIDLSLNRDATNIQRHLMHTRF